MSGTFNFPLQQPPSQSQIRVDFDYTPQPPNESPKDIQNNLKGFFDNNQNN